MSHEKVPFATSYGHRPSFPSRAPARRSACVDYLYYNPDGTIRPVVPTVDPDKLSGNTAYSPLRSGTPVAQGNAAPSQPDAPAEQKLQ